MNLSQMYFLIYVLMLLVLTLFLFITTLISNLKLMRKLGKYPLIKAQPFVSILVPARNEEKVIEKCVTSLLNQDYNNFEVIVLNDRSIDKTGDILTQLSKKYKNLKIITGKDMPSGWVGKNWACHQLSQVAKGDYLLFTDADTYHEKNMLINIMSATIAENAGLVSMLPLEKAETFGELLIIPFISLTILISVPLYLAYKLKNRYLSIAIGHYLLFSRDAYEKVGGFYGIKAEVLDDNNFVRKAKDLDIIWRLYDGSKFVSCRLYNGFRQSFNGFVKNSFAFFNFYISVAFFVAIANIFIVFAPIVLLILYSVGVIFHTYVIVLSALSIFMILVLFFIVYVYYDYPLYLIILFPLNYLVWCGILAKSIYNYYFVYNGDYCGRKAYDSARNPNAKN